MRQLSEDVNKDSLMAFVPCKMADCDFAAAALCVLERVSAAPCDIVPVCK